MAAFAAVASPAVITGARLSSPPPHSFSVVLPSLPHRSLSFPSYSQCSGSGTCGILLPESPKEKVLTIKTGDSLALPFGVLTWWFNPEDTELVILFLGDTSKGHRRGAFTNFQVTGTNGIFTGFTPECVRK